MADRTRKIIVKVVGEAELDALDSSAKRAFDAMVSRARQSASDLTSVFGRTTSDVREKLNGLGSKLKFDAVGRSLRSALDSVGLDGLATKLSSIGSRVSFGGIASKLHAAFNLVNPATIGSRLATGVTGAFNRVASALDPGGRLTARWRRTADEIGDSLGGLPERAKKASDSVKRAFEGSAEDIEKMWDRSTENLAADFRDLADKLPKEAQGIGRRIAEELDPRKDAARKFDALQDQLAKIAKDLPDEFQGAASDIKRAMEDAAAKAATPWGRIKERVRSELGDALPAIMRHAGRGMVDEADRTADDIPKQFGHVVDAIARRFDGLRSRLGQIGRVALGNIVSDVTGFLTQSATEFVGGSIEDAMQFGQFQTRSRAVFKGLSADAEQFAADATKNIGLSEREALGVVSALGNQLVGFGLDPKLALDQAKATTKLVSGFALLNAEDPSAVAEAMQASLRGEYDSLQRVVPAINAAAVEQKALAMTGKSAAKELTAQEKATATLAFIQENAGLAANFFGDTQDNAATKALNAKNRMDDLSRQLGDKLIPLNLKFKEAQVAVVNFLVGSFLPALSKLSDWLKDIGAIDVLKNIGTGFQAFFDALRGGVGDTDFDGFLGTLQVFGAEVRNLFSSMFTGKTSDEQATTMEKVGLAIRAIGKVIAEYGPPIAKFLGEVLAKAFQWIAANSEVFLGALAGIGVVIGALMAEGALVALGGVLGAIVSPMGLVVIAAAALGAGLFYAYKHSESFRKVVNTVVNAVKKAVPAFIDFVKSIDWEAIWEEIGPILTQIGSILGDLFELVSVSLLRLFQTIKIVIQVGTRILSVLWERWGDHIITILKGIWDIISGVIRGALDIIQGVIRLFIAIISGDWSGAWDAFVQILEGFWKIIEGLVKGGFKIIAGLFGIAWTELSALWGVIWDGIKSATSSAWQAVWDTVTDWWGDISDFINGIPGAIAQVGSTMWEGLKGGLVAVLNWIITQLNMLSTEINKLTGWLPLGAGSKFQIPRIGYISNKPAPARSFTSTSVRPTGAATGDVAFSKVVRMIGDNPNARRDPEIVSPLSYIEGAVTRGMQGAIAALVDGSQSGPFIENATIVTPPNRDMWQQIEMAKSVYIATL